MSVLWIALELGLRVGNLCMCEWWETICWNKRMQNKTNNHLFSLSDSCLETDISDSVISSNRFQTSPPTYTVCITLILYLLQIPAFLTSQSWKFSSKNPRNNISDIIYIQRKRIPFELCTISYNLPSISFFLHLSNHGIILILPNFLGNENSMKFSIWQYNILNQ